ncbi:MAG: hypothetical protein LUI07_00985, partial [Lachnospiraceae bacterium]|nr:hypothetical protein [Lachnospiraceae bacterium]
EFNPFSGVLYSQTGIVRPWRAPSSPEAAASAADKAQDRASEKKEAARLEASGSSLTPEQVVKMDWLAENVIGSIPEDYELTDQAKPVVAQQGIKKQS